jgi:hypothetical protein
MSTLFLTHPARIAGDLSSLSESRGARPDDRGIVRRFRRSTPALDRTRRGGQT